MPRGERVRINEWMINEIELERILTGDHFASFNKLIPPSFSVGCCLHKRHRLGQIACRALHICRGSKDLCLNVGVVAVLFLSQSSCCSMRQRKVQSIHTNLATWTRVAADWATAAEAAGRVGGISAFCSCKAITNTTN